MVIQIEGGVAGTRESCACEACQGACEHKPGWFAYGEAEQAAQFLGVTLEELFRTRLAVDWWCQDRDHDEDVFLLAPVVVDNPPGEEYPGDPQGTCTFFKAGRCEIHPVKPRECREYLHDDTDEVAQGRHREVADSWCCPEARAQIRALLGREPEPETYLGSVLGLLGCWESEDDDDYPD